MSTDFWMADPTEDRRDLSFRPADPAAARTLTAQQVASFNASGFLAPLDAFEADAIDGVRQYFDDLIDAVVSADDRRNSYSINAYHLVCAGIYDLILSPRILDYVQDIIGPDFVCWGSQVFCKMPGDPKEIPLHQDATYWPFTPTRSVTVWLAVDDVDVSNAAMEFAVGSHMAGPVEHREFELDGTRVLKRGVAEPERFPDRYVNAMPAGSLSLHNDLLLHGSPPNRSGRRRTALTIRYAAAEVDVIQGYEAWKKPAIHCRGTIPDHWPHRRRPDGEHPEKMANFWGTFDGTPPDAG